MWTIFMSLSLCRMSATCTDVYKRQILGFVDWPGIARLVRGNVLSLRESNFIKSDLVAGMPLPYILFSEILPNTAAVSYTHL